MPNESFYAKLWFSMFLVTVWFALFSVCYISHWFAAGFLLMGLPFLGGAYLAWRECFRTDPAGRYLNPAAARPNVPFAVHVAGANMGGAGLFLIAVVAMESPSGWFTLAAIAFGVSLVVAVECQKRKKGARIVRPVSEHAVVFAIAVWSVVPAAVLLVFWDEPFRPGWVLLGNAVVMTAFAGLLLCRRRAGGPS